VILICSLACQPALVAEDPDDAHAPSSWDYEEPGSSNEATEPPSLAEITSVIDTSIGYARQVTGDPIVQIYSDSLAGADDSCPGWYEFEGNTYWFGACTSELGTTYDGYGLYYDYVDEDLYGDGGVWNVDYLYGVANITTATTAFHLGGYVYYGSGVYQDYTQWQSILAGSFAWDGGATDSWMDDSAAPNLATYYVKYPSYDLSYTVVSGSIGGLEGGITALDFDDLTLVRHETLTGSGSYWPCAGEPMGRIHLRTSERWIEVAFEDIVYDEASQAYDLVGTCDGCGQAWDGGDYLGEVCVDAAQLLDWQEQPW